MQQLLMVNDPESRTLLSQHADPHAVHTNLQPVLCECSRAKAVARPPSTGNACFICGGITVQTGSCATCADCGATTGCG